MENNNKQMTYTQLPTNSFEPNLLWLQLINEYKKLGIIRSFNY